MPSNFKFSIDTSATVKWTNKLEQIHRSALPIAARSAINDTIFDVKTRTMPQETQSDFTIRQKNFFIANSKFIKAEGFELKSMKGQIGFYENKLKNQATNFAIKDLEQQEHGGVIHSKTFIAMPGARIGGKGNVRANARLKTIRERGIVDVTKSQGKTDAAKFYSSIKHAGVGGFILAKNILWRVNSVGAFAKLTPLYSESKGRSIHVNPTNFMKNASNRSHKKMEGFYIKQAQKQLLKYWDRK
jgi:hypothetical protein